MLDFCPTFDPSTPLLLQLRGPALSGGMNESNENDDNEIEMQSVKNELESQKSISKVKTERSAREDDENKLISQDLSLNQLEMKER